MAFITYPLNNIDYTAEDAELFHCTRTSGIWAENSFSISVTGADNNVTIGKGIAWINNEEFSGKVTALKSAEVLDLGIADSTYPRIDVIAIQFNANNNETDIIVKKGTPATNPVRPAIVRSGAVYELYLASVYRPAGAIAITASNITDLRMDETVCGLMADSVTKVDMTAIEAQVRSLINNLQNEIDSVRNLSGIMFESEWVEGDVIPISKGGTNATNVQDAKVNLGILYSEEIPTEPPTTGEGTICFVRNDNAPLPISGGGTGANNDEEALNNLGGISKTLLWENANSTSAFPPQSIRLPNITDYDEIEVEYRMTTGLGNNVGSHKIHGTGFFAPVLIADHVTDVINYFVTRRTEVSTIGVAFSDGGYRYMADGHSGKFDDGYCVPLAIYGIKGVK